MNFDEQKSVWTRICPNCQKLVEHKTKAKCRDAENHNKICLACSQALNGKKRRMQDTCPICQNSFACIKELDSHAASHNITGEELWAKKNNVQIPTCKCGCGGKTTFNGWHNGWNEFTFGCGGKIHTFLSEERCKEIAKIRYDASANWRNHWKGKTKETDPKLAEMSKKTAATRKAKMASGEITVWSKGKTKETDQRLADFSERQKERFAIGELIPWAKGQTKETDERLAKKGADFSQKVKDGTIKIWHAGQSKDTDARLAKKALARTMASFPHKSRLTSDEVSKRISTLKHLKINPGSIEQYRNIYKRTLSFTCIDCNQTSNYHLSEALSDRCRFCRPNIPIMQGEIFDFVKKHCPDAIVNARKVIAPLELDIFVPSRKLAIEFNGLYFHAENMKSSNYHSHKTEICNQNDIKLFHIFEDEWIHRQDVIKSMILTRLGKVTKKIDARKCEIVMLDLASRKDFLNENHLEYDTIAKIGFGLVCNNELVSVLSLRKASRESYGNAYEIARFSNLKYTIVRGALSRLVKFAAQWCKKQGVNTLMTYVDTRLGNSNGYENCGFQFLKTTINRFWWTDFRGRYNRQKFKATSTQTQKEVAEAAGVYKIYGCPNKVFILNLEPNLITSEITSSIQVTET